MCGAEILTMLGFSSFAALLPQFVELWSLSGTEAGWITGIFFAGYTIAVPVLVSLTDRVDPRRIWLASAVITVIAGLGFAFLADGFWTAMLFRLLAGMGLAGTYMPGLKALQDQVGGTHSRAVAFYTSSFGIGAGASYLVASWLTELGGWPAAFWVPALLTVVAALIVLVVLPWSPPRDGHGPATGLLDFRPVLRNRSAVTFTLCYAFHNWELFALRGWIVAYLAFVATSDGGSLWVTPEAAAAVLTILGMPASIWGNEMAIRGGRRRAAVAIMIASAGVCFVTGWTSFLIYPVAVAVALLHGLTVAGESSTVTAGAIGNAREGQRGQTMALHSTVGFAGGFLGPLVFGMVLDVAGGPESQLAWVFAFGHLGLVMLLGPLAIAMLRPAELPGDGASRTAQARP